MTKRKSIIRLARWIIGVSVALMLCVGALLEIQLVVGKKRVAEELSRQPVIGRLQIGSVDALSMIPLVDFYADRPSLQTEPGVSCLIRAGQSTILLDMGLNLHGTHPSPLLHNMQLLGIDPRRIDILFFSHVHSDHTGGRLEGFAISQGAVDIPPVNAYVPSDIKPSKWNPQPRVERISGPRVLAEGVASIGPIPRQLFLAGYTTEQALAVNLAGKGIVLFIGCGHQSASAIIDRACALFPMPIYAVIGGLHLPYGGGRNFIGPIDIQRIVASDRFPFPWRGKQEVLDAIAAIEKVHPAIVALSAHDSSDRAIEQFRAAFGSRYRDVKVGRAIVF